eukprot:49178-Eustigmatos_ZCMA.PRE.1
MSTHSISLCSLPHIHTYLLYSFEETCSNGPTPAASIPSSTLLVSPSAWSRGVNPSSADRAMVMREGGPQAA